MYKHNIEARGKIEKATYWLATYLVGLAFIAVGLKHLVESNTAVSDLLNLWAFLFMLGSVIIYFLKMNGEIMFVTRAEKLNKDFKIASILVNLIWFGVSLILAYWLTNHTGVLLSGLNTNGFSIMAMGISCLMIYHSC